MRISTYTLLLRHRKGTFIYNSLSNSLAKIEEDLFLKLENLKGCDFVEEELCEDVETLQSLKNAFMIIEYPKDDLLQYQTAIWERRRVDNVFNITVAPTMDCNFNCYYCFEEHEKEYMSEETTNRIVKYMNALPPKCHVNFTWFGGEPLLAFEQLKRLNRSLRLPEESSTDICIITNGYFMDKAVVDSLDELHVNAIQLSLDGLGGTYNQVKRMKNDSRCFDTLLRNLDYFAATQKTVELNIRVNMDKKLKDDFLEIARFFQERYPENRNIEAHPAFLKNICGTTAESQARNFATAADKMDFSLDLFRKTRQKSILYPQNNFSECAIRNPNSWAFGPDGSVYKCWENIGNKKSKVGYLDENGYIRIENPFRLNRYLYGSDPLYDTECKECFYLPICYGRCPHQRILEEFENSPHEECAKRNGHLEQYLTELIDTMI